MARRCACVALLGAAAALPLPLVRPHAQDPQAKIDSPNGAKVTCTLGCAGTSCRLSPAYSLPPPTPLDNMLCSSVACDPTWRDYKKTLGPLQQDIILPAGTPSQCQSLLRISARASFCRQSMRRRFCAARSLRSVHSARSRCTAWCKAWRGARGEETDRKRQEVVVVFRLRLVVIVAILLHLHL